MGTRGTIHFLDGRKTLCSIYRQYDCYPTGLGDELKDRYGRTKLLNGFGRDVAPTAANGMACLAAQAVGYLKAGTIGNVYMTRSADRQEYNYFISEYRGEPWLKLTNEAGHVLFKGPLWSFNGKDFE
jgi:hypothetical protein